MSDDEYVHVCFNEGCSGYLLKIAAVLFVLLLFLTVKPSLSTEGPPATTASTAAVNVHTSPATSIPDEGPPTTTASTAVVSVHTSPATSIPQQTDCS
ncbi:hypothetical protein AOLI_G00039110 [Acnodon oligacanthus]